MAEKYLGILPPGSIWYSLTREDMLALLTYQGKLTTMSPNQIELVTGGEVQAISGKEDDVEALLAAAGIEIISSMD